MKKVLYSIMLIGIVGTVVYAATNAFFSDTETSVGNTFEAGAIDLQIDNESWYNGEPREDLSWDLRDLTIEKFFDYADLKPGDWGEDTVSLHVTSNPAYACVAFRITENSDNGITEPEDEVDGNIDQADGTADGDLAQELHFAFWVDDGDNVLEDNEVESLVGGQAADVFEQGIYALADSQGGLFEEALQPETDYYIGKAWCYGDMSPEPVPAGQSEDPSVASGITCNGQPVSNISQTDKLVGDIQFYAVQTRHNEEFLCSRDYEPTWPRQITSTTGDGWASVGGDFTEAWQADGRWGDGGTSNAENEVRVGLAGGGSPQAQHQSDNSTGPWRNGVTESFTLTYDGGTEAALTIGDTTADTTVDLPLGDVPGANGKIGITVKTYVDDTEVKVENVKLDGMSPVGPDSVSESVNGSKEYLVISGLTELSDGFTLTGDLTFTWGGTTPSSAEDMSMLIQVENAP